jgi:transcriptional regulator with XRE-family HTH domain/predicted RNase H-like HicB family nuclease
MHYVAYISFEDDRVLATFPDCEGCQTFAEGEESIATVAREALEGWLEAHLVDGRMPERPRERVGAPPEQMALRVPIRPGLEAALKLRWARNDAALSQRDLGERAGVSQQQVAKLEDPDENPSLETLERVARVLGLHVSVDLQPLEVIAPGVGHGYPPIPKRHGLSKAREGSARGRTFSAGDLIQAVSELTSPEHPIASGDEIKEWCRTRDIDWGQGHGGVHFHAADHANAPLRLRKFKKEPISQTGANGWCLPERWADACAWCERNGWRAIPWDGTNWIWQRSVRVTRTTELVTFDRSTLRTTK